MKKKNIEKKLNQRYDIFFDRLENIRTIIATSKILQKNITDLILNEYKISNSKNIIELRKYLDIFQKELKEEEKYLKKKIEKMNK